MTTLDEFLVQQVHCLSKRAWIDYDEKMAAYLRFPGYHLIHGKVVETFDIATVETVKEFRGQGVFTQFLADIEDMSYPIYVENVMEARFQAFFEKRGYELVSEDVIGHKCFFKGGIKS